MAASQLIIKYFHIKHLNTEIAYYNRVTKNKLLNLNKNLVPVLDSCL